MRTVSILFIWLAAAFAATDRVRVRLTNEDVIRMVKAGFGDGVVLQAVGINDAQFDLSPSALAELRKAGVGESVITAMKATGPPPRHLRLLDPGVYFRRSDVYALVNAEAVAWRGSAQAMSDAGIVKMSLVGQVERRSSFLVLNNAAELLVVCEPGREASEYQLLAADVKDEWREFRVEAAVRDGRLLGFGAGGKTVLPVEVDSTFDLGVRVLLGRLPRGEYGVVRSDVIADGRVVPTGKIFTFVIE